MRICDLREKEVINVCDCKCIGYVVDVDIDECTGLIHAIIIPGPGRIFGIFGRDFEYIVPWCDIVRIGPDVILVEIRKEENKI